MISPGSKQTFRSSMLTIGILLLTGISGCEKVEKYVVTINKPDKVWDSYTLPSSALGGYTPVIDMEGNVVTHYDCGGNPSKLLPDSSILCYASKIGGFVQKPCAKCPQTVRYYGNSTTGTEIPPDNTTTFSSPVVIPSGITFPTWT